LLLGPWASDPLVIDNPKQTWKRLLLTGPCSEAKPMAGNGKITTNSGLMIGAIAAAVVAGSGTVEAAQSNKFTVQQPVARKAVVVPQKSPSGRAIWAKPRVTIDKKRMPPPPS
jgi:hypothetical protein